MLEQDIIYKIHADFGLNAAQALTTVETSFADELPVARLIRCIVYLSEGKLDKLEQYIDAAKQDPRDVMLWAEYDDSKASGPIRRRDFSQTFDQAEL
jgi:hypothetical protein